MDDIPQPYYTVPEVPDELKHLPDRIADTLADKTIFITGGTGFLGRILVEKILRICPKVKKIYLLVRPKYGKDSKKRIEEIFSSVIFDLLKKTHGNQILDKMHIISGDCAEVNLGLSEEDRALLCREVQIIYHSAATVRFDEPLRHCILLNTRGTQSMLELSKNCKNLLAFCYISTAYSQLHQKVLEEKAYPCLDDPHKIIKSCESVDRELFDAVSLKVLHNCPNGYVFSKNLAEGLVNEAIEQGLPCLILRPSIVIPSWLEPLQGWTDVVYGPIGILIGCGKGVIRTMCCDDSAYADFVPVDVCISNILLATWNYIGLNDKTRIIFNLTTSFEYKVSWKQIAEIGRNIITTDVPLNNAIWYPAKDPQPNRTINNIYMLLFHMIPGFILDALIILSGNKPVLVRVHSKIIKGFEMLEYFANNQWIFDNQYIKHVRNIMNEREKIVYKVEGDGFDVTQYFRDSILGARVYILKESPETIPKARRHMRMLYWLDVVVKIAFYAYMVWFFASWTDRTKNAVSSLYSMIYRTMYLFISLPLNALIGFSGPVEEEV